MKTYLTSIILLSTLWSPAAQADDFYDIFRELGTPVAEFEADLDPYRGDLDYLLKVDQYMTSTKPSTSTREIRESITNLLNSAKTRLQKVNTLKQNQPDGWDKGSAAFTIVENMVKPRGDDSPIEEVSDAFDVLEGIHTLYTAWQSEKEIEEHMTAVHRIESQIKALVANRAYRTLNRMDSGRYCSNISESAIIGIVHSLHSGEVISFVPKSPITRYNLKVGDNQVRTLSKFPRFLQRKVIAEKRTRA